jgi:hypothetical protein
MFMHSQLAAPLSLLGPAVEYSLRKWASGAGRPFTVLDGTGNVYYYDYFYTQNNLENNLSIVEHQNGGWKIKKGNPN